MEILYNKKKVEAEPDDVVYVNVAGSIVAMLVKDMSTDNEVYAIHNKIKSCDIKSR